MIGLGSIRIQKFVILVPLLVMVGFLSVLLVMNYRAQVTLRKTALAQMVFQAKTQAITLSHEIARCRESLETIAGSRVLSMFYENRALGMSMAYGLKESLSQIGERFDTLLAEKKTGRPAMFEKILLVDRDGSILSQRRPIKGIGDQSWRQYLSHDRTESVIFGHLFEGHLNVMAVVPLLFKGEVSGQIIAWLNPMAFFSESMLQDADTRGKKVYLLFDTRGGVLSYPAFPEEGLESVMTKEIGIPVHHAANTPKAEDLILVRVPVPETDFFMILSQPSGAAGYTEPSVLLIAMILVAAFVVGSMVMFWRMHSRELILETLLSQENIRKQEIEEKNIALETEVMISNSLEKSLKESEEKFKTVSMAAQDAIIVVNNKGQICFWNRAATGIFGYSAHEAMDRDFRSVMVHKKDINACNKAFETFRTTGQGRAVGKTVELEVINRQGALFPVELSLSAVKLDGQWQAIGVIRNISERRAAEAELESHRKNLENLVKERTSALEKAQKELVRKAVDAGRAQLSAMVLHNIGNAITPVSVNTEQLKTGEDFERIGRYLRACYEELADHKDHLTAYATEDERGVKVVQYMGRLIEALEDIHDRHKQTIQSISAGIDYVAEILSLQNAYAPGRNEMNEWVDLNTLVQDALKIQESSIRKRQIQMILELYPAPLKICLEKNKLMQVLVNFIKNSCEAMDENKGISPHSLTLSCGREGDDAVVEICDTGCGILPGQLDQVFELGVSSKGTSGFGLYYCKTFIEANNGSVTLESPGENKGAKVSIRFRTESSA